MCCQWNVHIFRQIVVLVGSCLYSVVSGMIHAFPSVINPAILSPNATDIRVLPHEASWIAGAFGLSGFFGFLILSPMFDIIGRKPVIICLNLFIVIGWLIIYYADGFLTLMIGRLTQGLSLGGIFIVAMAVCESSHKKRRGYFMTLKKASVALGAMACHSLKFIWSWREIVILGIAIASSSMILTFICPESPAFLAMKGRFDESRAAFYWLFGESAESQQELEAIISAQSKIIQIKKKEKRSSILSSTVAKLIRKDFQRSFFIVVLATLAMDASGRYFLLAYLTQMMVDVTGDISVSMYVAVAADILLVIALCLSSIIIKVFDRRTILLRLGFFTVVLMFAVSVTVFLKSIFELVMFKWLVIFFILLHSFISNIGLVPVIFVITAEIFPLEHKGLGSLLSGVIFSALYALTIKLTPLMLEKIGVGGTFAVFGLCVLLCLFVLYLILPETKDRSLQEIENEMKCLNKTSEEVILLNVLHK